ncbi:MAG: hypothetical protein AB7F35_04045 [Acetobacteraceae bacterium]
MTTIPMNATWVPTVEVTERSDGHFLPFVVGVAIFAVSAIVAIMMTGLPH